MSSTVLVPSIIALVLIAFGIVFALLGHSSERAYWAQRDPSGDSRAEATSLGTVAWRAGHYAFGEYRAPLRIMAIGVLLVSLGVGFAIVAVLLAVIG